MTHTTKNNKKTEKSVAGICQPAPTHWVGNGFPVQSLLHYGQNYENWNPFLLLDYAAPHTFEPNPGAPKGVGPHPHKGFETVTIVYHGEVSHRDSSGAGGSIREGDVQWMTAGGGILHEEFHSPAYSRRGGNFEMVQLWVNLPAKYKQIPASYQLLEKKRIPVVELPENAGTLRLIAGKYAGQQGAASTVSEIGLWDLELAENASFEFSTSSSHTLLMLILYGEVELHGAKPAQTGNLVRFAHDGECASVKNRGSRARLLILYGEPIPEPISGYGPFVMNTEAEIRQAFEEFENGKFGTL